MSDAFEKSVVSKRPKLMSYAILLCKDRDRAEDLVQDTMLRALSHKDQFVHGTNLDAWLTVILRNSYLGSFRKSRREVLDDSVAADIGVEDNSGADAVDLERLQSLMESLPAEQRRAVNMIAQGMSYEDVAKQENVAVGTVKSRVNRGREFLTENFEPAPERKSNTPVSLDLRPIDASSFELTARPRPAEQHGPVPELKWIEISSLRIDPRYQRDIVRKGRTNVHSIAREFDWTKFAPVVVAAMPDGLYAIVDGQHRTTAAALCGIMAVPCAIIQATPGEQAAAFAAINGNVTQMSSLQLHTAAVAAGDATAKKLNIAVGAAGVKILRYPVPSNLMGQGETLAVGALRQCMNQYGGSVLTNTLKCLMQQRDTRGLLRAQIIKALCSVLAKEPELFQVAMERCKTANIMRQFLDAQAVSKRDRTPVIPLMRDRFFAMFSKHLKAAS